MRRDPERMEAILGHIIDSIEAIESYVFNVDFDQFFGDQRTQEAVLFNLIS